MWLFVLIFGGFGVVCCVCLFLCVCGVGGRGGCVVVVMVPRFLVCFGVPGLFRGPFDDDCWWSLVIEPVGCLHGLGVWWRPGRDSDPGSLG